MKPTVYIGSEIVETRAAFGGFLFLPNGLPQRQRNTALNQLFFLVFTSKCMPVLIQLNRVSDRVLNVLAKKICSVNVFIKTLSLPGVSSYDKPQLVLLSVNIAIIQFPLRSREPTTTIPKESCLKSVHLN